MTYSAVVLVLQQEVEKKNGRHRRHRHDSSPSSSLPSSSSEDYFRFHLKMFVGLTIMMLEYGENQERQTVRSQRDQDFLIVGFGLPHSSIAVITKKKRSAYHLHFHQHRHYQTAHVMVCDEVVEYSASHDLIRQQNASIIQRGRSC